ncbi:MAG TPA: glycosyltransferase family 39 protein [Ktedonobacterales bacterium]|nr:glycosyltransferase family 39 protein [Ktedonobacterales bacterium]
MDNAVPHRRRFSEGQAQRRFQIPFTVPGWSWAALPALMLALIAAGLRLELLLRYPLLYDGDAYGRWLSRNQPFQSPWVPLFQLCLFALTRLADTIFAVQLLAVCFGVTAILAFWLLLYRAFGASIAYLGALGLALHPIFILFTIAPYQEGLFLTLACLAIWLALAPGEPRWLWLTLVTGLAALTRYEGWLLALLLWLFLLWRRRKAGALGWRFAAGSALALGWAPLLWIAVQRDISPAGFQTLAPTLNPTSLLSTLSALWPAWSFLPGLVGGILALGGFVWLGWRARCGSELAGLLLAFLAGDLLIIAFLRPFSPNNLRLPLLSLPVVLAGMAGLLVDGARFFWQRLHWPAHWQVSQTWWRWSFWLLLTALLLFWSVPIATARVAAYDALVRPAYLAAETLPPSLPLKAPVALIGNATDEGAFDMYAQQAGWQGQASYLVPASVNAPDQLAAALQAEHARLLIIFGSALSSAGPLALAQAGFLVPAGKGPGYVIWAVQRFSSPRP